MKPEPQNTGANLDPLDSYNEREKQDGDGNILPQDVKVTHWNSHHKFPLEDWAVLTRQHPVPSREWLSKRSQSILTAQSTHPDFMYSSHARQVTELVGGVAMKLKDKILNLSCIFLADHVSPYRVGTEMLKSIRNLQSQMRYKQITAGYCLDDPEVFHDIFSDLDFDYLYSSDPNFHHLVWPPVQKV